jgi:outer membrane receptor protein involved in Fe transport
VRLEREVGQLDFSDFVASSALSAGSVHAGNPDLEPQTSWVAEAAIEKHLMGAVVVLTARHQWISNVVDRAPIYSPGGVFDAPGNIGDAKENDLELNLTLPLDHLGLKSGQLNAQGTYRDSQVKDPTTGEERHISGQHRFDYEVHFTHDLPSIKSSWGIDVFNRWTETYYRFNEIDVYKLKTWVDVFIEYKPKPYWSFRLEGDNLGSRGFERVLNVYDGPRNTSPLLYIDDRRLDFGPAVYMRVRRTFG